MRYAIYLIVSMLILALMMTSCNLPSKIDAPGTTTAMASTIIAEITETAAAQPTLTPSPTETMTLTPTATYTSLPTSAPLATNTTAPLACNKADFVADVTFPDGTLVDPGVSFVKTWRLKNAGSCTWTSTYLLIFLNGERMNAPESQQLTSGSVPPGGTLEVSVKLTAPTKPGTYQGNFMLRGADGVPFGVGPNGLSSFWVKIVVGGTLTGTPATNTPTSTVASPTPIPPSPTPIPPSPTPVTPEPSPTT